MKTRTLPTGRSVRVHDNGGLYKRCQCARRQWSSCPHSWHLAFKWAGVLHRFPLDRAVGRHVGDRTEARREADKVRTAIREGRSPVEQRPAETPGALTFDQFGVVWRERARSTVSLGQQRNDVSILKRLGGLAIGDTRLGDRPIGAITEDDLEMAFAQLNTLSGSSWNKYRQCLVSVQKWGQRKGYLTRPWLSEDTEIGRKRGGKRERRLVPDELHPNGTVRIPGEERRLLQRASPWLQNLIMAALDTCCRRGELLALQWQDVSLAHGTITIRAENAKDRKLRRLPISQRLAAVLDMLHLDPAGQPHPPNAYVFGDAIGRKIADPKKQWASTLRAAGIVDLRFHDLRHEGASRLLEAGWPLQHVQGMLGHADARTTSTYVNHTATQLVDSMKRFGPSPFHIVSHQAPIERQPLCNDGSANSAQVVESVEVGSGAGDGGRTRDLQLGKLTLYH